MGLRRRFFAPALLFVATTLAIFPLACSSNSADDAIESLPTTEAGTDDATTAGDTSTASDGGAADAFVSAREPILGTLTGSCGAVIPELAKTTPSLIESNLTFAPPEQYVRGELSPGGQRLFDTPNAGGSSGESEVMSYEVLHVCEGADLLKTETEITYGGPVDGGGSPITDFLVTIQGKKVGVSVTRAYKPVSQGYTVADATTLLTKKLDDIQKSSARVLAADKWVKQILYVFAETQAQYDAAKTAWGQLSAAVKADTIVVLTRSVGGGFIYCNPDPPLGNECP
jgi:hypothetical protein